MEFLFKLTAAVLLTAIFATALKKPVPELSFGLQVAGVVLALVLSIRLFTPVLAFLKSASGMLNASGVYVQPVVKASVTGSVTGIGCALCKDAGQSALASVLELAGTVTILLTALPLMTLFVQTIGAYL